MSREGRSAPERDLRVVIWILVVFGFISKLQYFLTRIPWYRHLYDRHPFYVPETLKSVLEITFALVAVALLHRLTIAKTFREVGVRRPTRRMVGLMVLASLPMWIVFAATSSIAQNASPLAIAYLAGLSPLAEEIVFRGFAFGQLFRRGRLGFWPAILVTAAVFSLGHIGKGTSAGDVVGIAAITFLGGAFFAWLYARWGDNIVAPLVVHALMNMAWQVFAVGETAFAGWLPTVMQFVVVGLAIALTLRYGPRTTDSSAG